MSKSLLERLGNQVSESLAALHKVPQPIQLDSNPGLWSENGFFPTTTLSPWPDSPEDSEGLEGRGRPSSALEPKSGPSPSPGGVGVGGCASAPPQLHRDSLLGPRGNTALSCGQTRPAACPASSSPPPHLLTETRLLLFLTLQLPLAWGSPLHPPAPPCPNRVPPACHSESSSTTCTPLGAADARAGLWGKQNNTVTALSPQSPNSPTPTLSEPATPSLPCFSLSSWQRGREKWDFKGWGGQVGGDSRSQSWPHGGGRELSWTPEGGQGPPHSLQGASLSLKAQGLCPPRFPIPAGNMGKKGSGW